MGVLGKIKAAFSAGKLNQEKSPSLKADFPVYYGNGSAKHLFTIYNGEKNLGEIGPIKSYMLDYQALRLRSWQSFLESEITQFVMNKLITWSLGGGLKLQSEPIDNLLSQEKITLDKNSFSESIEARFSVFCDSSESVYSGMGNLFDLENEAFKNAHIGGDVLVVLRYIDNSVKVQLIDGSHIQSPLYGNEYFPQALANGNRIINGIELDSKDQHVAYFVRKPSESGIIFEVERIEARGKKTGMLMAYMVYGLKYRLNNYRGLPLISGVLETLKKLERYKEATVGSAEERQKIAYFIEHQLGSTGETPFTQMLARAHDADQVSSDLPQDQQGKELANTVAASTNKMTFNMPINSTIKSLDSKNELYFKDFYSVNIDLVCAALEIPPNVAMSKYDSNFSASRAALKDWEHTLQVKRKRFAKAFWQPIYDFFLEIEILSNRIQAPGYLIAKKDNNFMVLGAYRKARFVGPAVPHIDPLKEVNAERAKLGVTGAAIPLTTVEAATERLNEGESDANMQQYASELEQSKKLGIEIPEPTVIGSTDNTNQD